MRFLCSLPRPHDFDEGPEFEILKISIWGLRLLTLRASPILALICLPKLKQSVRNAQTNLRHELENS